MDGNWTYFWFMLTVFFGVCGWVGFSAVKIAQNPSEH